MTSRHLHIVYDATIPTVDTTIDTPPANTSRAAPDTTFRLPVITS